VIQIPEPKLSLSQPCHCGSGRKYKRCCWQRERQEYASALAAIREISEIAIKFVKDHFPDLVERAEDDFYGHARAALGEDEVRRLMDEAELMLLPNLFDALLADVRGPGGRPPLELFLDDRASEGLHPAAREFAAAWAAAPVSLYEVDEITPGEGMTLKDLLRRRRLDVVEKAATESLQRWDVLFARVAEMEGINLLTGGVYPLHRRDLAWVLEQLHAIKGRPGSHSLTWASFLKRDWSIIPALWFHLHSPAARFPKLSNMDGDPLLMTELEIEVRNRDELRRRLDSTPGVEPADPDSWTWGEVQSGQPPGRLTRAFLKLEDGILRVSVNSLQREARISELLHTNAGDCLGAVTRHESPVDLETIRDAGPAADDEPEPTIPPEIQRQVIHQFLEAHYRSWPDTAVPALDGRTPREAARDRTLRPRLISLLKEMELSQSRAPGPMASFDLSFLWAELGLKRP